MKVCPNCSHICTDQDAVCTKCGMAFPATQVSPQPQAAPVETEAPAQAFPTYQPPAQEVPAYQAPQPQNSVPQQPPAAPQVPTYQVPSQYYNQQGEEPVSTGKWLLYQLIPCIPFVGSLIYVIMMFIWSFGGSAPNTTFRNWARSQLILSAIVTVLVVVAILVAVGLGLSLMDLSEETTDYYSYY